MKKLIKRGCFSLGGLLLAMQLLPVDRTDPPVNPAHALNPPPAVAAILRPACYDCHSNETRWPWYSYVAPLSWWIANHVHDGRRRLNFSEWTTLKPRPGWTPEFGEGSPTQAEYQAMLLGHCEDEISKGRMPISSYLIIHTDARITPEQNRVLTAWFNATIQQLDAVPPKTK